MAKMGCLSFCPTLSATIRAPRRLTSFSTLNARMHLAPFLELRTCRMPKTIPNHFLSTELNTRRLRRGKLSWGLFAWGDDVEFSSAKVVDTEKVSDLLVKLWVDIGALASGYTKPGQFVQLKVGESSPAFIALASPPDTSSSVVEVLIKNSGGTSEALCGLAKGDSISTSAVLGKGFPVDKIPPKSTKTLFMFATGTGISPVKALIESGTLQATERNGSTLFYGARQKSTMTYTDLFSKWKSLGVNVIPVFSQNGLGYVQDTFAGEKENLLSSPESTGVVLCGQKEMCQAVTEMMTASGVDNEKIILNF